MICDFMIIGGDGDLAFRKLYPALYQLEVAGCLPPCLKIVGISRSEDDQQSFRARVREKFESYQHEAVDEQAWKSFAARLHYARVDATSEASLLPLREKYFADSNRDLIVYLATPPTIFAPVCQSLWAVGLVRPTTRIVVEKPLGEDLESFRSINASLSDLFKEEQVYRIDHYLGKETVQNLLAMRFANSLFEPLWNNNYIDHVQITVAETVGIEGRWEFYDEAGAMRDMVQNHLLQLLCLVAMEPPARIEARSIHDEKLKVLRALKPMSSSEVRENTVRGQYQSGAVKGSAVPGYLEEQGARPDSTTETFVAIKAEISNWRWSGVPFYLRTGKRLVKRYSEIVIQFKEVPHAVFGEEIEREDANRLIIRLQPEEGIRLMVRNKVPGLDDPMELEQVSLDLSLSESFPDRRAPDAYERLLLDVMRANSTHFMRSDELEAAWVWVDGIIAGWHKINKRPLGYTAGSWGPSDSIALIARDGRNWDEG
ncbi:MAG: glucose-6-phosphate dehydrogenase [Gammaproteobacteria bacterium]|nr:glucose-6-phosphate dehydrogenase [Pseudomonadales bacterium]MCP5348562.1 glucose-6-phosphate dehydrogenase [Pseudomonadales bacterium]